MATEIRVVVVGKTGSGKSSTINTIMEKKEFDTSSCSQSVTKDLQLAKRNIGKNQKLVLVDTPGIFDTNKDNMEIAKILERMVEKIHPGPHIYILVLAVGRFTEEERDTVEFLKDLFGEHITDYLVIVFTRKDDLDYDKMNLETYIKKADEDLKFLTRECKGMIAINNREAGDSLDSLLQMIQDVYVENKKKYYTDGMLGEAREKFDEKLRKQEEEAHRVERELEAKNKKLMEEKQEAERREQEWQQRQANEELKQELKEAKEEAQRKERGMKLTKATRLKCKVQQTMANSPNIITGRKNLLNIISQERVKLQKLASEVKKFDFVAGVGSVLTFGGAAFAPFTGGLSLVASAVGVPILAAATGTSQRIFDAGISKQKQQIINDLLENDAKFLKEYKECCDDINNLSGDLNFVRVTPNAITYLPRNIQTYIADFIKNDLNFVGVTPNAITYLPRNIQTYIADFIKNDLNFVGVTPNAITYLPRNIQTYMYIADFIKNDNEVKHAIIASVLYTLEQTIKNDLGSKEALVSQLKYIEGSIDQLMTQLGF